MDVALAVENHSEFTLAIVKSYLEKKRKEYAQNESNAVISPLSIATAIAMAGLGAKGDTLREITSVLKLPEGETMHEFIAQVKNAVLKDGSDAGGTFLSFANGLWIEKSLVLKSKFRDAIAKKYGSEITEADFATKAEEEWIVINSWMSEKTNGKIKNVLPYNCFNERTKLVLANALYFNGTWEKKFKSVDTKIEDFHLLDGNIRKVPFLVCYGKRYIQKFDTYKVLRLPYSRGGDWDRTFSMYFVLPNAIDGLRVVEKNLDAKSLNKFLNSGHVNKEVKVGKFRLPKFKISTNFAVPEVLVSLGMKAPFAPGEADFSDIVERPYNLAISDVFHKSFIEINEEGTEAAAATVVLMPMCCPPAGFDLETPEDFVADHPFLFILKEDVSGLVLFIGQIINPFNVTI